SAAEIFQTAVLNFPDIKIAEYRRMAMEKSIDIAKGNFYPSLNLQMGMGSRYSNGAFGNQGFKTQVRDTFNQFVGFGLNIPIFNGFSARSSVRRAKINYQNAELSEQLAKNNLNKVINQAVFDLRAAQKRFHSAELAFQSSKEAFNVIEYRYAEGLVNSLDF